MQLQKMKYNMQLQTNEAHFANANTWNTQCNCKEMKNTTQLEIRKHIKQLQTSEEHYTIIKKWSWLCERKQM